MFTLSSLQVKRANYLSIIVIFILSTANPPDIPKFLMTCPRVNLPFWKEIKRRREISSLLHFPQRGAMREMEWERERAALSPSQVMVRDQ